MSAQSRPVSAAVALGLSCPPNSTSARFLCLIFLWRLPADPRGSVLVVVKFRIRTIDVLEPRSWTLRKKTFSRIPHPVNYSLYFRQVALADRGFVWLQ